MINPKIFKAYDIRGKYPAELNEEAAQIITKALAEKVFKQGEVVVAHDARLSSPALHEAVLGVLRGFKFKIHEVGLATTPMFYFLVADLKASGGIMITASHNPKEYNGLKIIGPGGAIMPGTEVQKWIT